jgi:hypothetical protein
LSKDEISLDDIEFSKILIDEFLCKFEELYKAKHQTFNLHCLQHLPSQVENYGPNHKCDCFPFEGWFKNVKELHDGTNNLSGQIANNLNLKLKVHFELKDITIRKPELKAFVEQLSNKNNSLSSFIHEPRFIKQICTFTRKEQDLIKQILRLSWNSNVTFSHTATINNTSKKSNKLYIIYYLILILI